MSRRALVAAVALAFGCDGGDSSHASRERVNAVKAAPAATVDPAAMCDRYYPADHAPALAWAELTGPAPSAPAGSWRWINLWATWCKPCIEEMPRLTTWRNRLTDEGVTVELTLVSADASDEDVAAFRGQHPATPASLRLAQPDAAAAWIASLGVQGATLPVHIVVDPAGNVRCVRASAIEETDYPSVRALLTE